MKSIFSVLIYCLLISSLIPVSKGSKNEENEPFRMRKINLLWQKAQRMMLSQQVLNELFVELQRQDRDEKKWKHQKDEGKDKLGEMEAVLRRNLLNIMDKYGLMGASEKGEAPVETGDHIDTNRVQSAPFVKDERLEKLWEHAKSEGISLLQSFGCYGLIYIYTDTHAVLSRGPCPSCHTKHRIDIITCTHPPLNSMFCLVT